MTIRELPTTDRCLRQFCLRLRSPLPPASCAASAARSVFPDPDGGVHRPRDDLRHVQRRHADDAGSWARRSPSTCRRSRGRCSPGRRGSHYVLHRAPPATLMRSSRDVCVLPGEVKRQRDSSTSRSSRTTGSAGNRRARRGYRRQAAVERDQASSCFTAGSSGRRDRHRRRRGIDVLGRRPAIACQSLVRSKKALKIASEAQSRTGTWRPARGTQTTAAATA